MNAAIFCRCTNIRFINERKCGTASETADKMETLDNIRKARGCDDVDMTEDVQERGVDLLTGCSLRV